MRALVAMLLLCVLHAAAARAEERSPITHVVSRGETLSGIAERYGVNVASLRSWNELRSDRITPGQRLTILPDDENPWYVVGRGDTLSEIAERHQVSLAALRTWNDLESDRIVSGQKLRVVPPEREVVAPPRLAPPTPASARTIRRLAPSAHDAPTADELNPVPAPPRELPPIGRGSRNGATPGDATSGDAMSGDASSGDSAARDGDRTPGSGVPGAGADPGSGAPPAGGTSSPVTPDAASPAPALTHVVARGESLWAIASANGVSIDEIRRLNDLRGDRIHPGQELIVRPPLAIGPAVIDLDPSAIDWSALTVALPGAALLEAGNGPYYAGAPRAPRQSSRSYKEESRTSPRDTYRAARGLFEAFEAKVAALGRLSHRLDGWHVVLDPGHGGIDPGAITRVLDGRGDPVYVVEDEYVYDIALRMYVLLRLHGASVTLTILSPNHLIRRSEPATRTFVHERNEVFNSEAMNRRNRASAWPKGGQPGLDARVDVAREAFRGAPAARTLFISLHADSSPNTPMVPMILYYEGRSGTDHASRRAAEIMAPSLGSQTIVRGQGLGVLRNNPAAAKVLIEFRNVAFAAHAWALRFEDLRQNDAERAVKAILAYAGKR